MNRIRHISTPSNSAEKCQDDLLDENVPRTNPFLVPENYFDELPLRIMDRIPANTQKQHADPKPSSLLRRAWLATAAIAAIAVIFLVIRPADVVPPTNSPILNSIDAASFADEYDQTFADEALLLEENEITDNDVSKIDFKTMGIALNSSDTTSVTTEEIIQYLLDENNDTDLLAGL